MQLSIVIPVYNVENYISRCIESIIAQTYRNFELILVDDGSSDNSGRICDSYAEKHNFIKVYHIANSGPGGARNYGVEKATGNYVFFVDSDDYIAKETVGILYNIEERTNADIIVLSERIVPERGQYDLEVTSSADIVNNIEEYTREQSIELLGYVRKILNAPWGKLFRKDILTSIPFPENVIYEDYEAMYQILDSANKIIYVPFQLYYYAQRAGSIMHSSWNEQRNRLMTVSREFMDFVKQKYPNIYPASVYRYFFSLNELYVFAFNEKNFFDLTNKPRLYARTIMGYLLNDRNVSWLKKVRYIIMIYFPRMYRILWKIGKLSTKVNR